MISAEEYAVVERRNRLRDKVIRVDDFPYDFDLRAALAELPEAGDNGHATVEKVAA